MRKAPARRAAASSVPIVLIFMQVSTPSVFPSSQRSIQSCPAGQLHNSKEVGRTKTKDLSSYFLERGGCADSRRAGGADGVVRPEQPFAELTTWARRLLLSCRDTPPLRRGECAILIG